MISRKQKKRQERNDTKIGPQELLIVLIIVIILFGPTQIPKLTKMFGKSVKSFKEGMEEGEKSEDSAKDKTDSNAQ